MGETIDHRKLEVSEKAPKTWEKTGPGEFVLPYWKLGSLSIIYKVLVPSQVVLDFFHQQ